MHQRSCNENPNKVRGTFFGKTHTIDTKKKQAKSYKENKIPDNLYSLSTRTIQKIIQRMKINCSNCGWDKTTCDIHHIVPRSKGGTNAHVNLTILCPNCHRLAHENKLTKFTNLEQQVGEQWREYYFSHG